MSRRAPISERDGTPRKHLAMELCTDVTLPAPAFFTTLPQAYCRDITKPLATRDLGPLGTQVTAARERCAGAASASTRGKAHFSKQTPNIAILPEEIDPNGPCHLTRGVVEREGKYVRGDYSVSAEGCKRLYHQITGLAGWGCLDEGMTKRLRAYPYALLPQLLASGAKIFEFGRRTCEDVVDQVVKGILSPIATADIVTPFNLPGPSGDAHADDSCYEAEHRELLGLNKFLRAANRRFAHGLKRLLGVVNSPTSANGTVFAVQNSLKVPHSFRSIGILGSEITRHAAKCRSGFYEFLNVAKDKFAKELQRPWERFAARASVKGIAIPKSLARVPQYCEELWNKIRGHLDWKCESAGRGRYRLTKCPKGLERIVPDWSWERADKNCEAVLDRALRSIKLTKTEETLWTTSNPAPSAEGAYNRLPLYRVGDEPKGFVTTGLQQEEFIACYPHRTQEDAFYDALSVAAAEMQKEATLKAPSKEIDEGN